MRGQGSPNSKLHHISSVRWLVNPVIDSFFFTFVAALIGTCPLCQAFQQARPFGPVVESPADPLRTTNTGTPGSHTFDPGQQSDSRQVEMRLRMTWGGGNSDQWQGTVRVTNPSANQPGTISAARTISLANDSPGSIRCSGPTLSVNQLSPTNFGGADFTLTAAPDSKLEVELHSVVSPDRHYQTTVSVTQLIDGNFSATMDSQLNQFSVSRAPGDRIRVSVNQRSLVFQPNDLMSLFVQPNLTGESTKSARCRFQIVPARGNSPVLWSRSFDFELDQSGSSERKQLEIPVPTTEGVYDLVIDLEPDGYRVPIGGRRTVASRRVQFVVLDDQAPRSPADVAWRMTEEIKPEQIAGNGLGQLIRMANRSLGTDYGTLVPHGDQKLIQLEPGGWRAVELKTTKPGTPHVIEIEYRADRPMAMGLSVLQADPTGQIPLIGCDSGVTVPRPVYYESNNPDANPSMRFHRVVFWPGASSPYLLIANRDETEVATFGKIRVYSGPARLSAGDTLGANSESDARNATSFPKRKLMAFYEAPLFPENFDSHEYKDPEIEQPLDDWVTFYDGADRLVQYLKANSYRGAYITVASEGSSIFPCESLDATPKYDSGVFFSNGCDPVRKDVLEMLMQMFDREGLTLVPTVAMAGPLPEIEATRINSGVNNFDLVDFRNNKRTREQSTIPFYNPLDPDVQSAVTDVISELAQRYSHHSAFESVAVICRGDTYTGLPGQQWGYDPSTVARFRSDTGIEAATGDLLGAEQDAWISWRAERMTAWYAAMLGAVQKEKPGGQLFLAPVDLNRGEEISSALSPRIHFSTDFQDVMLRMGFESGIEEKHPGIVLLEPRRMAPNQALASERVEVQVENSNNARQFFRANSPHGSLFTHRMTWAHFAELQQHHPFHQQRSPLTRLQQLTPSGMYNRQRLIQSLRSNDSQTLIDGGILLPSGQDAAIAEVTHIFNQLPAVPFDDVEMTGSRTSGSPVMVRQVRAGDDWYFYAVNNSPWPVLTTIRFDAAEAKRIESLSSSAAEVNGDGNLALVQLEPFGLFGGRIGAGQSGAAGPAREFEFVFSDSAIGPMNEHLRQVQEKLVLAGKTQPVDVLVNADFETFDKPTLDGWQLGDQATARVRLENTDGYSGNGSLRMASEGQTVWIRSNEFPVPSTGRISVSVWIRTENPDVQPPLRIAVEGRSTTGDYYRFGLVDAGTERGDSRRIERTWQRFAVHFDDLPVEGLTRLRIGFDLMGAGNVQIDSVRVYDRWLDEYDSRTLTQLLASAGQLLTRTETQDSGRRILESYWPRFLDEHFELSNRELHDWEPNERAGHPANETAPPVAIPESVFTDPISEDQAGERLPEMDIRNRPARRGLRNGFPGERRR